MFDSTMSQFPNACQEPIEKQLTLRGKEFKIGHICYNWEFMFHEKKWKVYSYIKFVFVIRNLVNVGVQRHESQHYQMQS